MSTTWTPMTSDGKKDPTGVTVFTVDTGQMNYPTATGFQVDPDGTGALHVLTGDANTGEDIKAIHAPGRWSSAVVHGPASRPIQITLTDASGAVIARSSIDGNTSGTNA